MAKIKIQYDATEEVDKIIEVCKQLSDVEIEKEKVTSTIQNFLQNAFDKGRKFQKDPSYEI